MLNYNISASDSLVIGYNGVNGPSNSFNISGSAGFVSSSESHPSSFVYSGGYLLGNNGQPSSFVQNLGVSQVLHTRSMTFVLNDVVTYLPSSPRFGISGVPGLGDIGSQPISTGGPVGDGLLTNYGQRVSNSVSGSADYRLTGRTSVSGSSSYSIQRFLGSGGLDNNQLSAGGQLTRQFTSATVAGGGFTFSKSSYPQSTLSFTSQGVNAIFQHVFGPKLSMQSSAGPQWTKGSDSNLIPSRLSFAASLGITYVSGFNNYSLSFSRSTTPGSGVLLGALAESLSLSGQRRINPYWTAGVFGSYSHTQSLSNLPSLYTSGNSLSAGVQATRRLGEHWSTFASYAAQHQSISQIVVANNAFDGTSHAISFGVTYTPRPLHLGRR